MIEEQRQSAKERTPEEKERLCKKVYKSILYLILSIFIILAASAFISDIHSKYWQEVEKEKSKVDQCGKDYVMNNCDNPIPLVIDDCKRLDACRNIDPKKQIKTFNVLARIITEIADDLTHGLSIESIGLVAAIVLVIMCCLGKCSFGRNKDGKVNIQVGEKKEKEKDDVRPKASTRMQYKAIDADGIGDSDDSPYRLTQSQKGVLKEYAKQKTLMRMQMLTNHDGGSMMQAERFALGPSKNE